MLINRTRAAAAAIFNSAYALRASRAGVALSRKRLRVLTRADSDGLLIGGRVWAGAVAREMMRRDTALQYISVN